MTFLFFLTGLVLVAAIVSVLRRGMDVIPPGAGVGSYYINRGPKPRLMWVGFGAKCIRITWIDFSGQKRSRLVSWYPALRPFCLRFHVLSSGLWIDFSVICTVSSGVGDWAQHIRDVARRSVQMSGFNNLDDLSKNRSFIEKKVKQQLLRSKKFENVAVVISLVVPESKGGL